MSLNVKTKDAHRLARELSEMTGESMATAVTVALRERRDRLAEEGSRAERMLELGRSVAGRLPAETKQGDPAEAVYDDRGLPG